MRIIAIIFQKVGSERRKMKGQKMFCFKRYVVQIYKSKRKDA